MTELSKLFGVVWEEAKAAPLRKSQFNSDRGWVEDSELDKWLSTSHRFQWNRIPLIVPWTVSYSGLMTEKWWFYVFNGKISPTASDRIWFCFCFFFQWHMWTNGRLVVRFPPSCEGCRLNERQSKVAKVSVGTCVDNVCVLCGRRSARRISAPTRGSVDIWCYIHRWRKELLRVWCSRTTWMDATWKPSALVVDSCLSRLLLTPRTELLIDYINA